MAQEVAAWRERRAQVVDLPVRTVLPDLALQAIAHRPPSSVEALDQVRGLEGRRLRPEVAERGAGRGGTGHGPDRPPSCGCRPPTTCPRSCGPSVALVMAWVAQLARDERIDAALLATRGDLASYLRGDPESRLAHGWRSVMVAEPIRALVEGAGRAGLRRGRATGARGAVGPAVSGAGRV